MKRVLLTRRWPAAVEAHLRGRFDVCLNEDDRPLDKPALIAAMAEFDAICPTITDRLDAEVLTTNHARVRILANFGAGYEHIDLNAARSAGIVVTNTPDALTDSTADLAILLMLAAARRAGEGERELRGGRWTGWRPTHLLGRSITGKTLGLVGFGRIAQAVAHRAHHGFAMRIAYHSRHRGHPATEAALGATYHPSLDTLAAEADFLSLHVPGGAATRHLVDADLLSRMKPHATLINTARGTVVNEAELAAALESGHLAAAGLDVYEREPAIDPRLLACEAAVLLPHLGSATVETRTAMGMQAAANLEAFLAGEAPRDRVA